SGYNVFLVDKDPSEFFILGNYLATEYHEYKIDFYSNVPFDNYTWCWGYHLTHTPVYRANITSNPWQISLSDYSVRIKVKASNPSTCVSLISIYEYSPYVTRYDVLIDFFKLDPAGYYVLPDPIRAYAGAIHHSVVFKDSNGDSGCQNQVATTETFVTDLEEDPMVIGKGEIVSDNILFLINNKNRNKENIYPTNRLLTVVPLRPVSALSKGGNE
ncbi:45486_t:CDS:2, partial [Gigaspora margarita]